MCGVKGVVQFASLLEFAAEKKDGFGCRCCGGDGELEILRTNGQLEILPLCNISF